MNQNENLHSIQQVSEELNIPKPTLRFWEKEFEGMLQPLRTSGGQRRYTSEHIAIVEKINALKKTGLSLAEIKRRLGRGLSLESGGQRLKGDPIVAVDILVERVTEAVKAELLKYLKIKEEQESRRQINNWK